MFGALLQAMAWRDLHDPNIGGKLDTAGLLKLAREAGLDEDTVQKLATQRANDRLDMDLPM